MNCCCKDTERHDSREERVAARRRTLEEAQRQLADLEQDQEEAA